MSCASDPKTIETTTFQSHCPNCGRDGMAPFHAVENVPAHSCLLMSSREEAITYPRGDILLAFCESCGFLSNLCFDPALNDYSPDYEETQHFSPRFNEFAEGLVDRLVRDYDLRGKTVLEIGCGKAEFLAMLCKRGDNRGIGIDPSCRPERFSEVEAVRLSFICDSYSEKYSHLTADVVCCRHTLEHIQPTRDFLQTIRRSIGNRSETLMFFEVPDTRRVLREQAFWDIYYEHCSYFTAGSLARLFRQCGFELLELVRDFDDQYLWLTARPCDGPSMPRLELEDDLHEVTRDVEEFRRVQAIETESWKQKLAMAAADGRRPVVWGAGSKCVAFMSTIGGGDEIEYVVDINPHKHGKYVPGSGHEVVRPGFLTSYQPELVVAMNPVYCGEIAADLHRLGVDAEVIAV